MYKSQEDAVAEKKKHREGEIVDSGRAPQVANVKGDDDAGIEGSNTLWRSSQKRRLDIAETESDNRDTKGRRKV